ncbi:hypothetical protein M501DRAFT_1000687 [Patellaria atrata CBS 101060]|uniref:Protein FAF1 n=1 Tax=Patellaria atrata CBS 101060 TaxID=1346257 RepID=A0A9P4SEQ3_9PEZI|nr:hypothetical protein M501DRAFT_1000687 [Patellaria atrata CBS 101060]
MAVVLGMRKRQTQTTLAKRKQPSLCSSEDSNEDLQAVFRRHFEAQFKPLDKKPAPKPQEQPQISDLEDGEEEEEEEEEDWAGLSPSPEPAVEIIEHVTTTTSTRASKSELKAFHSSKPPSLLPTLSLSTSNPPSKADEDDTTEAQNLKNDLALQRLLSESHLLSSLSTSTSLDLSLTGRHRHKSTDLRLLTLGARSSLTDPLAQKMPMAMRRGILGKQAERESKRRKEARENGVILERAVGGSAKKRRERRERGVGAPTVGRFKGGTLSLSRRDVASITGAAQGGKGRRKGKGRKR